MCESPGRHPEQVHDSSIPTFDWSPAEGGDFLVMRVHPIALVARALLALDYLRAGVEEEGGEPAWIGMGVTYAVEELVKAGKYNAAGELLRGLESLVPAKDRGHWPLARWAEGEGDLRSPVRAVTV